MRIAKVHIAHFFKQKIRAGVLLTLLFLCSLHVAAQNTKGDRPIPNQRQVREAKFKSVKKTKRQKTRVMPGRRFRTLNKSSVSRAGTRFTKAGRDKLGKPLGKIFNTPPGSQQRAWKGDISGRKIRIQSKKNRSARSNVFPQRSPYVNTRSPRPKIYTRSASGSKIVRRVPQDRQKAWKGNLRGGPVGTPSRSGKYRKIYPQDRRFVNPSSKRGRNMQRFYSNRSKIARTSKSASRPFIVKKKINTYWGKYSKGEKPYTKDITGRPLRMRNFRSTPAGLVSRNTVRFFGRKPRGDRPHPSSVSGGFITATKQGRQAWKGDISGHKLRSNRASKKGGIAGKLMFSKKLPISSTGKVGKKLPGGGYRSRSGRTKANRNPLPPRAPGIGAKGINYQGRLKKWALLSNFSKQDIGFAGNIKSKRPAGGGGSISGKHWNNRQSPLPPRIPKGRTEIIGFQGNFRVKELAPGFTRQGVGFAGNIKTKRPQKGGGSISGKLWNNRQSPLPPRIPKGRTEIIGFQGNFRVKELAPGFTRQGIGFAGNIKTNRPQKGGGSISGKLWNNRQSPLPPRIPKGRTEIIGFQGNFRVKELAPGFTRQGIGFAGNIKTKRPQKGGGSISGKLWNNHGKAIERSSDKAYGKVGNYQGNIRMKKFSDSRLHPDAKFAHGFRSNVKEERTIFINFKLMWAKLFKKSDTQPDHLKEKHGRPRYDKSEKGMWYE